MDNQNQEEYEGRLKSEMSAFINRVKEQMRDAESVYTENLMRVYNEINSVGAQTVFFLDRSARPVAWMVEGLFDALGKSKPEFKFISIAHAHDGSPTPEAIQEAKQKIEFNKDAPILIVDDFSESTQGKRLIDHAARVVSDVFNINQNKVNKIVFLQGTRRPAMFYNAHGFKTEIYGIKKASVNSIVSVEANSPDFAKPLINEYKQVFYEFGKKVGGK